MSVKKLRAEIDTESPAGQAIYTTRAALDGVGGVSGLSAADVLSDALADPDVQAALVTAVEAMPEDAEERVARIVERKADEEEERGRQRAKKYREVARKIRSPEPERSEDDAD